MYVINKIIGWVTNPFTVTWLGLALGCLWLAVNRKKAIGLWLMGLSVAWLWLWSTPLMCRVVGASLERPYLANGRVPSVESFTNAAAIVLHGGSMGDDAALGGRGEMWTSADRVWMAARLWHAQAHEVEEKGGGGEWMPKLFVTGGGVRQTTAGLLEDFGIPTNAIVFAENPRNTEEEARFIADALKGRKTKCLNVEIKECLNADQSNNPTIQQSNNPKVLVVTSAWHMKRTMLMYAKYAPGVEAIPAPCDFENTVRGCRGFSWGDLLPSDEALVANRVSLHEWVGITGYRWFRR